MHCFLGGMYILVKMPSGEISTLMVNASDNITSVKTKIQTMKQISPDQQQLIFDEEALEDQFCLSDYGIQQGDTLELLTGKHKTILWYCSLVKEGPWAVHLTLGLDGGRANICDINIAIIHESQPKFTYTFNVIYSA